MNDIALIPPNLAALGVSRQVQPPAPDLITVWQTPYPVLTNYKLLCADVGIEAFAGGTYLKQGSSWLPGYVSSGYRVSIGAENSPHKYALAIDVVAPKLELQIELVRFALKYFTRSGLYPNMSIIHLDLMPAVWIKKFNAARHWVCFKMGDKKTYHNFGDLDSAIRFAIKNK